MSPRRPAFSLLALVGALGASDPAARLLAQEPEAGAPETPGAEVQIISGIVLDAPTREPLAVANVVVEDVKGADVGRFITDEEGRFWVRIPGPGLYSIRILRLGYDSTRTVQVGAPPGQNLFVEIRATPIAVGLGTITVSAPKVLPYLEASGFYDRMRRGHGSFMGPGEIQRFPAAYATHLLRRMAGITVSGRAVYMRGTNSLDGPCSPRIVLDGMMLGSAALDDLAPVHTIDAIEVYRGAATVPAQWRGNGVCGVIAVWTKHY